MENITLVFDRNEMESFHFCGGNEKRLNPDGVTHRHVPWPFPDALPCAWTVVDPFQVEQHRFPNSIFVATSLLAREAYCQHCVRTVDAQGNLRRGSLVALGLASEEKQGIRISYLDTKVQVDREARNPEVYQALINLLRPIKKIRVLDVGAGSLSLVDTVKEAARSAGVELAEYVAVDADPYLLETNRHKYPEVTIRAANAFALEENDYDLVVANAFADLASPNRVAALFDAVAANDKALLYLPITFAGTTRLEPQLREDDAEHFDAYHDHLRYVEGQHLDVDNLVASLEEKRFSLVQKAPSDWVIPLTPQPSPLAPFLVDFLSNALSARALDRQTQQDNNQTRAQLSWIIQLRDLLLEKKQRDDDRSYTLRAVNFDLLFRRT